MKVLSALFLSSFFDAFAALSQKPGICNSEAACTSLSPGYSCVSLQTIRPGTEDVKQCISRKSPTDVCSGTNPSSCPLFKNWPSSYQKINSVCALIVPTAKCGNEKTTGSKGTVDCIDVVDEIGKVVQVIYGCVDFSMEDGRLLFQKDSKSDKIAESLQYSKIITKGCKNSSIENLCSGRGTCAPKAVKSLDYYCKCGVGSSGQYCENVTSDVCDNPGQCSAGTCNLKTQKCECPEGTTGFQCLYCDAKSDKACNAKGKCVLNAAAASSSSTTNSGTSTKVSSNSPQDDTRSTSQNSGQSSNGQNQMSQQSQMQTSTSNATRALATDDDNNNNGGNNLSKYMCKCNEGWKGDHCDQAVKSKNGKSGDDATNGGSGDASSANSLLFSGFVLAMSLIFAAAQS